MKRIVLMIIRNILMFPFFYIKMIILTKNDKYTEEQRYSHLKNITYHANKKGRVIVEASGEENLPKENGYILYPNHQGMYDALAIIATHERPFSIIMKKELMKVPMLKDVFACNNAIAIDREDIRQSMKVINQVSEEVKKGRNFLIFPEGTRSKEGNQVQEFKGGSFKAALKAKCPIVPVALVDAFVPFDISSIKKVTVKVIYLEPIYYEEYKDMKTSEIAKEVQNRIQAEINRKVEKNY